MRTLIVVRRNLYTARAPRLSDDHPICSVFTWHSVSQSSELYRRIYIVCSTWIHPLPIIALHPLSYHRWHITISLKNESSRHAIIVVIEIDICAHIFPRKNRLCGALMLLVATWTCCLTDCRVASDLNRHDVPVTSRKHGVIDRWWCL